MYLENRNLLNDYDINIIKRASDNQLLRLQRQIEERIFSFKKHENIKEGYAKGIVEKELNKATMLLNAVEEELISRGLSSEFN